MTDDTPGEPRSLLRRPITGIRAMMAAVLVVAVVFGGLASLDRMRRHARDAAFRSFCVRNLKEFAIGIASYNANHGCFPPGMVPNEAIPPDRRIGWAALLSLSCSACEDGDLGRAWDDPQNRVLEASSSSATCPQRNLAIPTGAPIPASFVGIAGLGPDAPGLPVGHPRAGIFGDDRRVTPADVKDGLGNTMMVAEVATSPGPWYAGARATVRGVDPAMRPQVGVGRPFGGIHGEGANVLMADGSVRWVRQTQTSAGFEAMSTIAGSEVVSDPDDSP